jgi:hypothetical protein
MIRSYILSPLTAFIVCTEQFYICFILFLLYKNVYELNFSLILGVINTHDVHKIKSVTNDVVVRLPVSSLKVMHEYN